MSKACRFNNCMSHFESDDELVVLIDDEGVCFACPDCKTDEYLMTLDETKNEAVK